MKVLLINVNVGNGSVGRIVEDLYYGIVNSGNKCKIAYARKNISNISSKDLYRIGNFGEIIIHTIFSRITDRAGFYSKSGTKKLIDFIEEYKPDIIHMHGNYGYYLNIEMLFEYLSQKNILIINTLHSCWDFTGHCCYFTYINCDKWKNNCNKCPQKKSYPASYLMDNSESNFKIKKKLFTSIKNQVIVTPSNWLADICKQSFLSKYPVKVINNGIDLEYFKNSNVILEKYGIDKNKKIILGVSSGWEKRKGINDFYELSQKIDNAYQIVLVGLKKKQLKLLPKNIIGITKTDSKEELASLYSIATVLFNPTYEDNYPTVNLEAIACGTPVITYNTGGSPEFILKHNVGKVIEHRDYKSLLEYVDYYKSNKIHVTEEMLYELSKSNMVNKYVELYKKGLNNINYNDGKYDESI